MATKIGTLQNPQKTEALLPRTCLKAIADKNGDYLDEDLTASDINALKNGRLASLITQTLSQSTTETPSAKCMQDTVNNMIIARVLTSAPTRDDWSSFIFTTSSNSVTVGNITIPAWSFGVYLTNGGDAVIIAYGLSGVLYVAFRNNATWGNGRAI